MLRHSNISFSFAYVQVEIIKDKAREFAALPQDTLASLKKQCCQPVADSTQTDTTNSTVLPTPQQKLIDAGVVSSRVSKTLQQETCAGACVSFLPTKCAALEMEGSTPLSGATSCRNVPCAQGLSAKSDKIWNNNNNIETSSTENFVTTLSNGNGVVDTHQDGFLSNTDCVVPESDYLVHNNSTSKFVPHYSSNLHSTVSLAPYSEQKLLQSAVELIDSGPCLTHSSTCPKPAFVDPSKPGQVLQVRGGSSDMAAASSASSNTKKAELKGVRLTSTVKSSSPLPNGSINNKKLGVSTLQKAAANSSSNSLPNDSTPLMGNSQRTDSSVCVKQYGTNVPSNRHDHLQSSAASCSVDSDEPQDKSKLAVSSGESDGTIGNKPTTLGEQFEASKAQEGKKKKSKKKKKNKGEFWKLR